LAAAAGTALALRPARDADAQELFGLLALCFADYPGCFVDPHDDLRDLLRPGQSFPPPGGFFVLEDERGRVGACAALAFPEPGMAELHRVYVRPDLQRRGLGRRLSETMLARAAEAGAARMILYSDTRFAGAHAMYRRLGFARVGEARPLGDVSNSHEYRFERLL
jgi:GNAT superfamily N-acetyltransferase